MLRYTMYVHESSPCVMCVSLGLSNPHEFSFTVDDDSSHFTLKKVRALQGGCIHVPSVRSRKPFQLYIHMYVHVEVLLYL